MVDDLLDFEEIERKRYENMNFAKRVVLCSFTEILFQRKLLPNDAFKAVRLKGIKLFILNADHDDAYENLVKLGKICEEIENESVKTLRFLINCSINDAEHMGELFEIHFSYGERITVVLKLGDSTNDLRFDEGTHMEDFKVFIMRLRQFCRMLRELPEGSYGRYHVVYNNGKKMRESTCEYFTKVVRAPLVWNGPKQDICGIVGPFNKKEIGMKMSVGTLFGTGATDSMALIEHLREENWDDGGWNEQRESHQRKSTIAHHVPRTRCVSYIQDSMEEIQEVVNSSNNVEARSLDQFEWNDEAYSGEKLNMSGARRKVSKEMRSRRLKEKGQEKTDKGNTKRRRPIEKKLKVHHTHTADDGLGDEELSLSDSAQRGSDIDSSTFMAVSEEAKEKEGRMEQRRRRKREGTGRKETLDEAEVGRGVTLGDIERAVDKTPGESMSTNPSSDSSTKTPGVTEKRNMILSVK